MRFVYPKGKRKALTFSYDDAQVFDRELVRIFNKYNVKGTFHLNSGTLSEKRDGKEFFISKEEVAGRTETRVRELSGEERVEEIARILGGIHVTDTQRQSARELMGEEWEG